MSNLGKHSTTNIVSTKKNTRAETVVEAMRFEPPILMIERFATDHNMQECEVRELFEEVKKFLTVSVLFSPLKFAPNKKVDNLWHEFVLFTMDYHRFSGIFGRYIHHVPTAVLPDEVKSQNYQNTLQKLEEVFGTLNKKWWNLDCAGCVLSCDTRACETDPS